MQRALQYLNKMRRVLVRRGKRREDIEDLMQDAFVRILEYTRAGHEVREPEALLVRTAQRLALNHTRDQHLDLYVQQPVENLTIFDPGPAPQEVLEAEQCLKQIARTLDGLSRRTRDIFFLQRLDGFSYTQIAKQTGIPVSTVEKHIARAMTALLEERRRKLQELEQRTPVEAARPSTPEQDINS
jgi:RNA polymerase sigma-70 factor (ECF subfamily)